MLSPEFTAALKSGNLLRVRIMLKDSLIVDPTFAQFNEMFASARRELPNLLVPFDGEILEDDRTKWNTDLMNTELVEIVNNFSDVRIEHLKRVIGVVMAGNIKRAPVTRPTSTAQRQSHAPQGGANFSRPSAYGSPRTISPTDVEQQKLAARKQALSQITNSSKKIGRVMDSIQDKGKWMLSDIQELENAASQILSAAKLYKNNR